MLGWRCTPKGVIFVRIGILGGAGNMGSTVVRTLAGLPSGDLIIADRNEAAAEALASTLGGNVHPLAFDAGDRQSLAALLDRVDLVVNCVGPFYRYAPAICLAAVRRGVHYVDICDDSEPTLEMLTYDAIARSSGATAVIGCGWTPGITNVCARLGAERLDRADSVEVTWIASESDVDPDAPGGVAVEQHVLHILSRPVPLFKDGEWLEVSPLDGDAVEVMAPKPLRRKVRAYLCGHPEPLTLPRYLPQLSNVSVRGAIIPEAVDHIYTLLARLGVADTEERMAEAGKLLADLAHYFATDGRESLPPYSAAIVEVSGVKNGAPATLRYTCVDHMDRLTGVPAAIAALLISEGKVHTAGVVAPEAAFDPRAFLAQLSAHGIRVSQRSLTRSAGAAASAQREAA